MGSHLIIDGNAVYEVDEDCMLALEKKSQKKSADRKETQKKEAYEKNRKSMESGFLKNDL